MLSRCGAQVVWPGSHASLSLGHRSLLARTLPWVVVLSGSWTLALADHWVGAEGWGAPVEGPHWGHCSLMCRGVREARRLAWRMQSDPREEEGSAEGLGGWSLGLSRPGQLPCRRVQEWGWLSIPTSCHCH